MTSAATRDVDMVQRANRAHRHTKALQLAQLASTTAACFLQSGASVQRNAEVTSTAKSHGCPVYGTQVMACTLSSWESGTGPMTD